MRNMSLPTDNTVLTCSAATGATNTHGAAHHVHAARNMTGTLHASAAAARQQHAHWCLNARAQRADLAE
jgi:hypothetical protein